MCLYCSFNWSQNPAVLVYLSNIFRDGGGRPNTIWQDWTGCRWKWVRHSSELWFIAECVAQARFRNELGVPCESLSCSCPKWGNYWWKLLKCGGGADRARSLLHLVQLSSLWCLTVHFPLDLISIPSTTAGSPRPEFLAQVSHHARNNNTGQWSNSGP